MNVFRPKDEPPFSTQMFEETPAFSWVPHTLSFLRRRWGAGLLGLTICAGLALGYSVMTTPIYTSTTAVMIDIRRTDLLSQQQNQGQDAQTLNAALESQVEILRSQGLARKVVTRLDLVKNPLFVTHEQSLYAWARDKVYSLLPLNGASTKTDDTQQAAETFQKMTGVRRIGLTYVIEVSIISPSADLSARLANGLVDAYITDQMQARENTTKEASIWLQDRLSELRDQAVAADTVVERYKSDKGIVSTDKGLMNEQQLEEINTQLTTARGKSAEAKSRLDRITTIMKGDVLDATVADGLQNTVINGLRLKYLDDVQQEAEWSAKFGSDHSAVIKIRAEMKTIQRAIRQELGRIAESYQSDYSVAHADEMSVEARMRELLTLTARTNGDRVALRSLQSSAETYRTVYEKFLLRYTQAVQDQSFPVSEARVITVAEPPLKKSWPKNTMIVGGGAVSGILLGFMVAFLRETLDRGIRTTSQLRTATGLECIGMLPGLGRAGRKTRGFINANARSRTISTRSDILRYVLAQPNAKFSEAIRALASRVSRNYQKPSANKLIGIVSARQGEGSSTVVANLAQSLANSGHRTLLIDWSGSLTMALTNAPTAQAMSGFLDLMAGNANLSDVVWTDPDTGLAFLPLGTRSTRLVINEARAHDVRAELLRHYDIVLVDIPALSPVVDIHAATQMLDAFVLVVAWGKADQDRTMGALTGAELDDRRILGAVFNGVDLRSHLTISDQSWMVRNPTLVPSST